MPFVPSGYWANAAGEAAEASNLNDLETRIKAAVGAFAQHTWTQKTSATPLSANELNKLEARHGVNLDILVPDPTVVTDWGAVWNTAKDNGARCFRFSERDYPYSTFLDGRQTQGIAFRGPASGFNWYDPGLTDGSGKSTGKARLVWTGGAGSGNASGLASLNGFAMDMSSAATGPGGNTGLVIEDMTLTYDNAAFDGTLLNTKNGGFSHMLRSTVGATGAAASSGVAKCGISLNGVNTFVADNCTLAGSPAFAAAIRGRETGSGYTNVVDLRNVTLNGGREAGIMNPGFNWTLDHCILEGPGLPDNKFMIDTDIAYTGDGIGLTLISPSWWDFGGTGKSGVRFKNAVNNSAALKVYNNEDQNSSGMDYMFQHLCTGSITIVGGNSRAKVDVGDGSVGTQRKGYIYLENFNINSSASKTDRLLNVHTGHHMIHISAGVAESNDLGTSGQVKSVSAQRALLSIDTPTIARAGGAPLFDVDIIPSPIGKFYITIRNGTGSSAGANTVVADVTLPFDIASMGKAKGLPGSQQFLLPNIGPMKMSNAGTSFTPTNGTWGTVLPEAHCSAVNADAAAMTKFSIYFKNNLPNNECVGIAVDLTHH